MKMRARKFTIGLLVFFMLNLINVSGFTGVGNGARAEEGGAAAGTPAVSPEVAANFPVYQASVNKVLGGNVRGFGMPAKFETPGPKKVYVRRTTKIPEKEPFKPICLVRVFNPAGDVVAYYEFTDQSEATADKVLDIPDGEAGIWRVSFSGGREGDRLEIGLPKTDVWGVRGEMALGITETTPKTAYIYMAKTSGKAANPHRNMLPSGFIAVEAYGKAPSIQLMNEQGNPAGTFENKGGRNLLVVDPAPENVVWSLNIGGTGGALGIDGVPGLLCPTKEAAEALKGGTVEAEGFVMAGPLQARLRKAMVALKDHLNVNLEYPVDIPTDMLQPQNELLLYGKYSILSNLDALLKQQDLNSADSRYGQIIASDNNRMNSSLASAVAVPGLLNPAYGNQALLNRAVLNSFSEMVWLQGDDLYRTDDFRKTAYPIESIIFTYNTLMAEPYLELKDMLDPETSALWKQMLMAAADKMADFQGYESNQWSFVMLGHLHTYLATGEERFLGYFEREMEAYVDGAYGPASKFGQHPAGFYLEEFGPDGNYDSINSYHVIASYMQYKELPEAKPELVAKLKNTIDKNLYFKSFYWLPQPDGRLFSPTAMNCRVDAPLSSANYPGDYLARSEFPLGLKRFLLNKPGKDFTDLGSADVMPHLANTDEWAIRTLEKVVPSKGSYEKAVKDRGVWTYETAHAYALPIQVQPASIPVESESGTWTLPGQIAWKRGPLYGLVFYDVVGAKGALKGKFGGGPTVFWSEGTGNVVSSMRNASGGKVSGPNDITHSCIFGTDENGKLFYTGEEHPDFKWIEEGKIFEIKSALTKPQGELTWHYELSDEATTISVSLKTDQKLKDTYLNLPIGMRMAGAQLSEPQNGKLTFTLGQSKMEISWPENVQAKLDKELKTGGNYGTVSCLRIPMPTDGSSLTVTIKAVPAAN